MKEPILEKSLFPVNTARKYLTEKILGTITREGFCSKIVSIFVAFLENLNFTLAGAPELTTIWTPWSNGNRCDLEVRFWYKNLHSSSELHIQQKFSRIKQICSKIKKFYLLWLEHFRQLLKLSLFSTNLACLLPH